MKLKQFLIARTAEDLSERSCVFEVENDEQLRCLCQAPSGEIDELFAQLRLISRWSERTEGRSLLQLLAAKYAGHEEFDPEWLSAHGEVDGIVVG